MLEPNEELCQMISLNSESSLIIVSDAWTKNESDEWKITLFNTTAEEHGLAISYPKTLSINERQVNVCISGTKEGEFHGVIIMSQKQQGNSIIQMGVWLKVIIKEKPIEQATSQTTSQTTTTPSSSGGSSSPPKTIPQNQTQKNKTSTENSIRQLSAEKTQPQEEKVSNIGITGKAVTESNNKLRYSTAIIILIIIALAIAVVYIKKRQNPYEKIFSRARRNSFNYNCLCSFS